MMFTPLRLMCRVSHSQVAGVLNTATSPAAASTAALHTEPVKMNKFTLADKYKGLEKNVWVEFIQLALEYKPLNLGQGFPDDLVPNSVLDSLAEVAQESVFLNQYTRGFVS